MAAENSSGPAEAGALSRDGGFAGLAYVASSMKASLFLLVRALRFGSKRMRRRHQAARRGMG
jgi:hypothetical protein